MMQKLCTFLRPRSKHQLPRTAEFQQHFDWLQWPIHGGLLEEIAAQLLQVIHTVSALAVVLGEAAIVAGRFSVVLLSSRQHHRRISNLGADLVYLSFDKLMHHPSSAFYCGGFFLLLLHALRATTLLFSDRGAWVLHHRRSASTMVDGTNKMRRRNVEHKYVVEHRKLVKRPPSFLFALAFFA